MTAKEARQTIEAVLRERDQELEQLLQIQEQSLQMDIDASQNFQMLLNLNEADDLTPATLRCLSNP